MPLLPAAWFQLLLALFPLAAWKLRGRLAEPFIESAMSPLAGALGLCFAISISSSCTRSPNENQTVVEPWGPGGGAELRTIVSVGGVWLYGSLSSPGLGVSAAQLEVDQPAVPAHSGPCEEGPVRVSQPVAAASPSVCVAGHSHPERPPCPAPRVAVPLTPCSGAFAWLRYQIAGIPEEAPCSVCQRRSRDGHPLRPCQVPSLLEPSLGRPRCGSYEVPFLEPGQATALAGARCFQGSGLVWVL